MKKQVTHDYFKYASVGEVKSSHRNYTSHWVSQAQPKKDKGKTMHINGEMHNIKCSQENCYTEVMTVRGKCYPYLLSPTGNPGSGRCRPRPL